MFALLSRRRAPSRERRHGVGPGLDGREGRVGGYDGSVTVSRPVVASPGSPRGRAVITELIREARENG